MESTSFFKHSFWWLRKICKTPELTLTVESIRETSSSVCVNPTKSQPCFWAASNLKHLEQKGGVGEQLWIYGLNFASYKVNIILKCMRIISFLQGQIPSWVWRIYKTTRWEVLLLWNFSLTAFPCGLVKQQKDAFYPLCLSSATSFQELFLSAAVFTKGRRQLKSNKTKKSTTTTTCMQEKPKRLKKTKKSDESD